MKQNALFNFELKNRLIFLVMSFLLLAPIAVQAQPLAKHIKEPTAVEDKVIASKIIQDKAGVTEGDGMYSILLPDGRSIFLMGDSYTGEVTNGKRTKGFHMYRNTYHIYDNGKVSSISDVQGKHSSAAVPPGVTDEGKWWYWPGHGFVSENKLYIFQTLMYQGGEGMWGFRYKETHLLEYELPSLRLLRNEKIPFPGASEVHYGMAAMNDGDYIYIYAQVDERNDWNPIAHAYVARTTHDKLFTEWEYYTGSGWSKDHTQAVKMEGTDGVAISSQFNVFKLKNKYVLLTQHKQFNSGKVYTFIADNPWGPWRNQKLILRTKEQEIKDLFTYNAMAHPQFSKNGRILVTYNVNTSVFSQQAEDVTTYRPRFYWVKKKEILRP